MKEGEGRDKDRGTEFREEKASEGERTQGEGLTATEVGVREVLMDSSDGGEGEEVEAICGETEMCVRKRVLIAGATCEIAYHSIHHSTQHTAHNTLRGDRPKRVTAEITL